MLLLLQYVASSVQTRPIKVKCLTALARDFILHMPNVSNMKLMITQQSQQSGLQLLRNDHALLPEYASGHREEVKKWSGARHAAHKYCNASNLSCCDDLKAPPPH